MTLRTLNTLVVLLLYAPVACAVGIQTVNLGPLPQGNRTVGVRQVASLSGAAFTQMAVAPGWDRLGLFSANDGRVYSIDLKTGASTIFMDVSSLVPTFQSTNPLSGRGLRGLAFHPDFNDPTAAGYGRFYTSHEEVFDSGPATHALNPAWSTNSGRQDNVLAEWRYDFDQDAVDPSSYRQVYRVQYPFGDHVMQQIAFNPAARPGHSDYGKLYIPFGDGGGNVSSGPGVDINRVAQDSSNVLASIIRIDPLQDGANPFSIPADNPWVGNPDVLDEIYAYGFRHPQTLGFDPADGRIFSGDIGQNNLEEINLIGPGGNYGWATREGTYLYTDQRHPNQAQRADTSLVEIPLDTSMEVTLRTEADPMGSLTTIASRLTDEFTYPVLQVDHINYELQDRTAIVSGSVYRGRELPELDGLYLFGLLSNNKVFYADADALTNDEVPAQAFELKFPDSIFGTTTALPYVSGRSLMRFGTDASGRPYIFTQTGLVLTLESLLVPEPGAGVMMVSGAMLSALLRPRRRRQV